MTFKGATHAFEHIIRLGVHRHASDIHVDPLESETLVRLRVDGMIYTVSTIPASLHDELISHIKILSGNRTDVHVMPQDGRCAVTVEGTLYNIRTSFMPTFFGENVVLRLLPVSEAERTSFEDLGFSPLHIHDINTALRVPHGMLLVTGPTGSGKTTTLRSCLMHKVKEHISVVTLEDPIEYTISGARQIRVEHSHGVTFARVLRSVLRQDPDVIMIGEIRDRETAELAMHAALTGHAVYSTIHTNNVFETIVRLIDMGIDPYIIASTLRLIVSQRLVRVPCVRCAHEGCGTCSMSGYSSRTVIAETLHIDEQLRDMIHRSVPTSDMKSYALAHGFVPLTDHAHSKVEQQLTTPQEVARVCGA